jgi:hypothetical protein
MIMTYITQLLNHVKNIIINKNTLVFCCSLVTAAILLLNIYCVAQSINDQVVTVDSYDASNFICGGVFS